MFINLKMFRVHVYLYLCTRVILYSKNKLLTIIVNTMVNGKTVHLDLDNHTFLSDLSYINNTTIKSETNSIISEFIKKNATSYLEKLKKKLKDKLKEQI